MTYSTNFFEERIKTHYYNNRRKRSTQFPLPLRSFNTRREPPLLGYPLAANDRIKAEEEKTVKKNLYTMYRPAFPALIA